jgi:lipopolysaccharide transport system permease protein
MTGFYSAIFGQAFVSQKIANTEKLYYDGSILNYTLAAFTGLVVINFFSASTTQALSSVVGNGSILNKIRLPVSIFPLSMIAANVFQLSVGVFPILAIVTLVKSRNILNVFELILPFIGLVLVCSGVGFLVSALYVFFRDLPYFYELVVFVLWLSSPIFYPAEFVSEKVRPFLYLNPLFPIIESIRKISLEGEFNLSLIGSALLSGTIILSLGWTCFHLWRSQYMDLL